jgi:hypothetical protein
MIIILMKLRKRCFSSTSILSFFKLISSSFFISIIFQFLLLLLLTLNRFRIIFIINNRVFIFIFIHHHYIIKTIPIFATKTTINSQISRVSHSYVALVPKFFLFLFKYKKKLQLIAIDICYFIFFKCF